VRTASRAAVAAGAFAVLVLVPGAAASAEREPGSATSARAQGPDRTAPTTRIVGPRVRRTTASSVRVRWRATDERGGARVGATTVLVQRPGRARPIALRRVRGRTTRLALRRVGTYRVFLVSRDRAGNRERRSRRADLVIRRRAADVVAERPEWRSYVLDDADGLVLPRVVHADGAGVDRPEGLRAPGGETTVLRSGTTLTLDLGVNEGGIVEAGVVGGDGATVRLAYSEIRKFLSPVGDTVQPSLGADDNPDGRYDTFPAQAQTFRSPAIRGAQRWIQVSLDGPGQVELDWIGVRTKHQRPGAEDYVGHVLTSDRELNEAFYAAVHTQNISTARAGDDTPWLLLDGAKRDRLAFVGDMAVATRIVMASLRNGPQLVRDTLDLFACQQREDGLVPGNSEIAAPCQPAGSFVRSGEYVAWYVVAAGIYWRSTGHEAYLRKLLPSLRRAAGYLRAEMQGDLYTSVRPILDYNWHAEADTGTWAHTNLVVVRALRTLAQLEREVAGDATAAKDADGQADRTAAAVLASLYDEELGAFRINSADAVGTHGQDAVVQGILSGVLTGEQATRGLRFLDEHLDSPFGTLSVDQNANPTFSQYISPLQAGYELDARFRSGDDAGAFRVLRRTFGYMVRTDPQTSTWERIGINGEPAVLRFGGFAQALSPLPQAAEQSPGYTSAAHAWGGGAAPALLEWVVGARPTAAGFRDWVVDPHPGTLGWAQGVAPTPAGGLQVRWERDDDRSFRITVVVPPSLAGGTVVVPEMGRSRTISRDEIAVWKGGRPVPGSGVRAERSDRGIAFSGVRGVATFAWSD